MGFSHQELGRILILDRDPLCVQLLSESLRYGGFQALAASTVEQAFEIAVSQAPDLVLLDPLPPGLEGLRLRERLLQSEHTRQIPVVLLVGSEFEDRVRSSIGGTVDYVVKPFDPRKVVACVRSYLPGLPHYADVDSLTDLPGQRWVEHQLDARLSQKKPFALVNVEIDSLPPYRNTYGSLRADAAIRLVASILAQSVKLLGNADDLVGHVGDNVFYIITTPDKASPICQRAVSFFDDRVKDIYAQRDVVRGYLECEHPLGRIGRHPLMTLSVGVTTSGNIDANDALAMRRAAREVGELARSASASAYRLDRRRDDLILEGALKSAGRRGTARSPGKSPLRSQTDKEEFIGFVTNQLRVPVTVMQSTIDYLIQTEGGALTAQQKHHLEVTLKHARHLSEVISQLATFCEVSRGNAGSIVDPIDLKHTLTFVTALVEEIARDKGVRLQTHVTDRIERVTVDQTRLCQAVQYALHAAVECSPPGATIDIDTGETESRLRIVLATDELHLSSRELARAFRSFCRPGTSAADHGSLGLGFHLARQLLRSIGGTISVRRRGRVYISLDLPKEWQSVDERAAGIQKELASAEALVKAELRRVEQLLSAREEGATGFRATLDSLSSIVGRMAFEANRAIRLLDDTLGGVAREREQSTALSAGFLTFLETTADLVERRDIYFAGHSRRVASEAFSIGQELGLPQDGLLALYEASLLHDLGMIAVPDRIVGSAGELGDDELVTLRQHPLIGSRTTAMVDALGPASQSILHHHERHDGTGYPLGLKGEQIPVASRILAVADSFDALTSFRPHRTAISSKAALDTIVGGSGTQFDPVVVEAFLKLHGREVARGDTDHTVLQNI